MGGVHLDTLSERIGIHAARFYLGKGGFPHTRHFDIGNLLVLDNLVNGKPLVSRHKVLLLTHDVLAGEQRFDNRRTGGGRAYPGIFQAGFQFGIFQFLSGVFHCRKQAAFRVQRFRLGLLLQQFHVENRQAFALLKWRQAGGFFVPARFLLAEHGTPACYFHHSPFYREVGISSRQYGGGNVFHALARKGFQHTPGYQLVNRPLVFGEFAGQVLGND